MVEWFWFWLDSLLFWLVWCLIGCCLLFRLLLIWWFVYLLFCWFVDLFIFWYAVFVVGLLLFYEWLVGWVLIKWLIDWFQHKEMYLVNILNELAGNSFMIFSSTCSGTIKLALILRCLGKVVHYSTVQHSTAQYRTVQYITVQYGTAQYSTVLDSTVQYSAYFVFNFLIVTVIILIFNFCY